MTLLVSQAEMSSLKVLESQYVTMHRPDSEAPGVNKHDMSTTADVSHCEFIQDTNSEETLGVWAAVHCTRRGREGGANKTILHPEGEKKGCQLPVE